MTSAPLLRRPWLAGVGAAAAPTQDSPASGGDSARGSGGAGVSMGSLAAVRSPGHGGDVDRRSRRDTLTETRLRLLFELAVLSLVNHPCDGAVLG
jgi:hypothetical protein